MKIYKNRKIKLIKISENKYLFNFFGLFSIIIGKGKQKMRIGTEEWADEWCNEFISVVESEYTIPNGCDICPYRDRCGHNHNGFLDWWKSTLEEYKREEGK